MINSRTIFLPSLALSRHHLSFACSDLFPYLFNSLFPWRLIEIFYTKGHRIYVSKKKKTLVYTTILHICCLGSINC